MRRQGSFFVYLFFRKRNMRICFISFTKLEYLLNTLPDELESKKDEPGRMMRLGSSISEVERSARFFSVKEVGTKTLLNQPCNQLASRQTSLDTYRVVTKSS